MVATSNAFPAANARQKDEPRPPEPRPAQPGPAAAVPGTDGGQLATILDRDVRAVLRALRGTAVEEMRLQWGAVRIALRRDCSVATAPAPVADGAAPDAALIDGVPPPTPYVEVRAHMVGPFHRSREPEGPVLVEVGDRVTAGQAIGVIETLGMATDVEAPAAGTLERFVVENDEGVEYGQVLAVINTEAAPPA
jgi:acetyl-CoA carboxylase biotin carboxyl carrier protein